MKAYGVALVGELLAATRAPAGTGNGRAGDDLARLEGGELENIAEGRAGRALGMGGGTGAVEQRLGEHWALKEGEGDVGEDRPIIRVKY